MAQGSGQYVIPQDAAGDEVNVTTGGALEVTIEDATSGNPIKVKDNNGLVVTPTDATESAFGEVLTASPSEEVSIDFNYNINADLIDSQANQSGSVTQSNAQAVVASGAAANSSGRLLSKERIHYIPGRGVRARFTALFTTGVADSEQIAGVGDASNGFFFGYNGTAFGVLHRKNGSPEIRTLTISQGANDGTGTDDITITLDGDAKTVTLTDFSGSASITANTIAAADYTDTGRGWDAYAVGATVVFVSWDAATHTGSYSLVDTDSTGAVGTFAQTVAGAAPTDTWVAQASWNGSDIFDGNGLTGVTLDPTKGNVYQVVYQWLGYGAVKFYIEDPDDGEYHLVHTIEYANANTTPTVSIPHLKLMVSAENTANTSNLTVSTASMGGFVDGASHQNGKTRGIKKAITSAVDFGAANDPLSVLNILNKPVYQSKENAIKVAITNISAATTGGKSTAWSVKKNCTIVGASWSDVSANTSVLQSDTSGTTVTGGTTVAGFGTSAGGGNNVEQDIILYPGETLSIVADPTANGTDVAVAVNVAEIF